MIFHLHLTPDESRAFLSSSSFQAHVNRICHRLRIELDVTVSIVGSDRSLLATYAPLKKAPIPEPYRKESVPSFPAPPILPREVRSSRGEMLMVSDSPKEPYQTNPPNSPTISSKGTIPRDDDSPSLPPPERIDLARVKLKKKSRYE